MITIRINGKDYSGFVEAYASKDIEDLCGQFSFVATGYDFPIKCQDKCEIYVNGKKFLTGFVEKRNVSVDSQNYIINIAGRDKLSLLVDNTVAKIYQYVGGQTIGSFCQNLINDLGLDIKVIAKKNPVIPEEDFPSSDIDSTVFEVIDDVCKRLQVLATSDENGNLVLMEAGSSVYPTSIINQVNGKDNNVLSMTYSEDFTDRFGIYRIYSQDNFSVLATPLEDESSYDIVATATDTKANPMRKLNIIMRNSYSQDQAGNYAKYTANVRRVKSTQYEATLLLHQGTESGDIWRHNYLYNIIDDYAGTNTQMLCKGINYSFTNMGESTTLNFVPKDAFKVQADKPVEDKSYFGELGLGGIDFEE